MGLEMQRRMVCCWYAIIVQKDLSVAKEMLLTNILAFIFF